MAPDEGKETSISLLYKYSKLENPILTVSISYKPISTSILKYRHFWSESYKEIGSVNLRFERAFSLSQSTNHWVNQSLVPVSEVGRKPSGGLFEALGRPLAIREIYRLEVPVFRRGLFKPGGLYHES